MMSWCLRNKAKANTVFSLEWNTKRQRRPPFWDDWYQKSSWLQPRAHGLPIKATPLKHTFLHSFPDPQVHACWGAWLEAEESGAWVLVLCLVLQLSMARSLLRLAALCPAGVYSRFEGQYSQMTPGEPQFWLMLLESMLYTVASLCPGTSSPSVCWEGTRLPQHRELEAQPTVLNKAALSPLSEEY